MSDDLYMDAHLLWPDEDTIKVYQVRSKELVNQPEPKQFVTILFHDVGTASSVVGIFDRSKTGFSEVLEKIAQYIEQNIVKVELVDGSSLLINNVHKFHTELCQKWK